MTDRYGTELLGRIFFSMDDMEAEIMHGGHEIPNGGLIEYRDWHEVLECDDCGIHGNFNGGSSYVDLSVQRAREAYKNKAEAQHGN
jgi:hypothetical protein